MKKRKPNGKIVRERREAWGSLVKKWGSVTIFGSNTHGSVKKDQPLKSVPLAREDPDYPSLDSGKGNATLKDSVQYTGSSVLGIATLHKSISTPIFNQQAAIDAAHMRR